MTMYLAIGIVDITEEGLTYERIKYFYLFPTEDMAKAFVQQVYRRRTAGRWEIVAISMERDAIQAVHGHIEEADDAN